MQKHSYYTWLPWVSLGFVVLVLAIAFLQAGRPMPFSTSTMMGSIGTRDTGGNMGFFDESVLSYAEDSIMPPVPDGYLKDDSLTIDQKIIKTGYLTMTVQSAEATANALQDVAAKYGGTVTSRSLNQYEDGVSGFVTLNVDAAKFETAMQEIKAMALVVDSETVNADDVTETVIDLEVRLRNARAEEARYLEVLQSANTVKDILEVENYLAQTREIIERYQAQLNYYEEQTSYSTITVSLTEETSIEIGGRTFRPKQDVINAIQSVVDLTQQLISGLIYVIIVGGAFLLPILLIVLLVKTVKHARK